MLLRLLLQLGAGAAATRVTPYPTILEIAGLPARQEQAVDGMSFVSLLKGGSRERGPIYWHYPPYGNQGGAPSGAVRDGDWKLIECYEDGALELFDLKNFIGEKNNLAAKEPARTRRLHAMLKKWRETTGAEMPTPNR